MLPVTQEWKPNASQLLREACSAKIEWARKLNPKLKENAEAPEETEELRKAHALFTFRLVMSTLFFFQELSEVPNRELPFCSSEITPS